MGDKKTKIDKGIKNNVVMKRKHTGNMSWLRNNKCTLDRVFNMRGPNIFLLRKEKSPIHWLAHTNPHFLWMCGNEEENKVLPQKRICFFYGDKRKSESKSGWP